jgi:peptidoglycan hydrolase-like protein with peptidoglycan-binding domain
VSDFGFPFYSPWYYPYPYSYDYYPYGYGYPYGSYYGGNIYGGDGAYNDSTTYYSGPRYSRGLAGNNSTVTQVQRGLAREGYYKGAIDGEMGPRTHYAIKAYQREHNLRVNGTISDQLIASMGLR